MISTLMLASAVVAQPAAVTGDLVFEPAWFAAANPVSALDMVRRVPGFAIESGEAVRGYAGSVGNVLVDGARPSTKNRTLEDVLAAIPASQVSRIELIRSARPGIERQGADLLVNVVRQSTSSRANSLTLSGYSYPENRFLPSLKGETSRRGSRGGWEASALLSVNQDESGKGESRTQAADGSVMDRARIAVTSPISGIEARLAGDSMLAGGVARGNISVSHQNYRVKEAVDFIEGPRLGTQAHTRDGILTDSAEIGGEWSRTGDSGLSTKLLLLATRKDVTTRSTSQSVDAGIDYGGRNLSNERILRAVIGHARDQRIGWELSAEVARNTLDGSGALVVDGEAIELPNSDIGVQEWRAESSAKAMLPLSRLVSLELGLGTEFSRLTQENHATGFDYASSFTFLKPKLLATWTVGAQGQLRLRLEREVGQLDFNDFASSASLIDGTVSAGNLELRPQTAWVFEAVLERRFGKDSAATLSYRHERIDNVLDRTAIDGLDAPGNIGPGRINAVALQLGLPLGGLGLEGGRIAFSGEWRASRVRDPITGDMRGISALAPFAGDARVTLDRPALRSTFTLEAYFGQSLTYRRIDEIWETSDGPYVSAKWSYQLKPHLLLETSVQNILSRKRNRDVTTYDGPRDRDEVLQIEHRQYRSTRGLFLSVRYQN